MSTDTRLRAAHRDVIQTGRRVPKRWHSYLGEVLADVLTDVDRDWPGVDLDVHHRSGYDAATGMHVHVVQPAGAGRALTASGDGWVVAPDALGTTTVWHAGDAYAWWTGTGAHIHGAWAGSPTELGDALIALYIAATGRHPADGGMAAADGCAGSRGSDHLGGVS